MNLGVFRQACLDAWQLRIAPDWPTRLPWPQAYACLRRLAARNELFKDPVAAAEHAMEFLGIADRDGFRRDVRTTWLLDAADLHLSRRHDLAWWPEAISVKGAWPREGAFVVVTFHCGTGLCMFRSLRQAGHRSRFLSGRFDRDELAHRPQLYRYGMQRMREVERLGGAPIAYRPGVRSELLDALAQGISVVGLIDVPPRLAPRGQHPLSLMGRPASLPEGLLTLAREAGVPIVPSWVEMDFASGRRKLVIGEARSPEPVEAMLAGLAADLERLVLAQPAAWMFWQEWPVWQRDAASLHPSVPFSNAGAEGRLTASASEEGTKP